MSGKQEGPTRRPGLEPGKVEMAKKGLFWVWGGSDVSTISPHLRKPTPAPGLGIEHPNIGPLMYHQKLKPARGEWEFPFPVIPGKTILKCQFSSRGILFFPFPFPGKGSFCRELRREILSLFAVFDIFLCEKNIHKHLFGLGRASLRMKF